MTRVNLLALGLAAAMGNSVAFSPLGLHDDLLQESFQAVLPSPSDSTPFPVHNATHSFWLAGAPGVNPLAREGSSGPLTTNADICIIGSGITGVSVAYHLAEMLKKDNETGSDPLSVVILEARDFCELLFHLLNATYLRSLSRFWGNRCAMLALTAIDAHACCLKVEMEAIFRRTIFWDS
jgi:FAD dependent oxidoreductase